MTDVKDTREQAAREYNFKQEVSSRVRLMLDSGISTAVVAEILGAGDFLEEKRGGVEFKVADFINSEIEKGATLKLPEAVLKRDKPSLPPGAGNIEAGSGKGIEPKEIIHRTRFFIDLLSELNLDYKLGEGTNTPTMMRGRSYQDFYIPSLKKLVLVNNEEGNASFILHDHPGGDKIEASLALAKDIHREGVEKGDVSVVQWPDSGNIKKWKTWMRDLLLVDRGSSVGTDVKNEVNILETPTAPVGWYTVHALADDLQVRFGAIRKIAERYRKKQPQWFEDFRITSMGQVFEHLHPLLVATVKEDISSRVFPPEGWLSSKATVKTLGIGVAKSSLTNFVEQFRDAHPEWFGRYTVNGFEVEFYAPEFIVQVRKIVDAREFAPEGWVANNAVAAELGLNFNTVKKITEALLVDHPEWKKEYFISGFRKTWFYHPDLIKAIRLHVESMESAPDGWMVNRQLATKLGVAKATVAKFANTYRAEHRDWFVTYRDHTHQEREHYHPDLVKEVEVHLGGREAAPVGWQITMELANRLGRDFYTVQKLAEQLGDSHEDWFRDYVLPNGRVTVHYHPELVEKITQHISSREVAPESWRTLSILANELKVDFSTVKRIRDKYKKTHPEWLRQFESHRGKMFEYIHPDLVHIIREDIKGRKLSPVS